ncbi:hypothetical protein VAWG002_03420 [Aeromonas veronii]|nr:hypothetical protein VAWG002_03420 [Aeromonas veronii]
MTTSPNRDGLQPQGSLRSGLLLPPSTSLPAPHTHSRYKQVASIGNPGDDAPISSNAQTPPGKCADG